MLWFSNVYQINDPAETSVVASLFCYRGGLIRCRLSSSDATGGSYSRYRTTISIRPAAVRLCSLQDQMLAVKATLCNFIFTLKQQRQNHVDGSEFVTDWTVSLSLVSALCNVRETAASHLYRLVYFNTQVFNTLWWRHEFCLPENCGGRQITQNADFYITFTFSFCPKRPKISTFVTREKSRHISSASARIKEGCKLTDLKVFTTAKFYSMRLFSLILNHKKFFTCLRI